MNEKLEQYLEHIFKDVSHFEKILFEIESDSDRKEILELIAHHIVYESELKSKVNFLFLNSYNNLDLSDMAFSIVRLLLDEAVEWLEQYFGDGDHIRQIIQNDKLKVYFIHELSMSYYFDHTEIFVSQIAESYFELLKQASNFRQISKVGHDAVTGTSKQRSLFLTPDGAQVVRRADQVWMRVDQASKAKKRKIFTLTNELKKYKEQVEDLQVRLQALQDAQRLTPQALQKFTPQMIRDIFTEDDPKHIYNRRLLASVPAGDLAYQLETLCERAAIGAKTPLAREEFKKIKTLFAKAKINNTPKELELKRMEYEHKLPFKRERYKEAVERYQSIKDEPLEHFDEQLKKIKDVMVENLKKRPVQK